jgi:hypothetical protein
MSDLGHSRKNAARVLELIDAIKSARSPAQVRELGEELVAVIAADRAGDEADEARAESAS